MATTARDIIQDSLEILGVYSPGETLSDADLQRSFTRLNNMLDMWSNENLACFELQEQSFPLVVGKAAYTIGAGGDVNVTRPLDISSGPGAAYILDTNNTKYYLSVEVREGFNLIGAHGSNVTANVPTTLFWDPQFPLGVLTLDPFPNAGGYTCFFDSFLQLSQFSSPTALLSMPPGYELALKTNLAVQLKPYFSTAILDPEVKEQARDSKAAIKRTNIRIVRVSYDDAIVSRGTGAYNIYADRPY